MITIIATFFVFLLAMLVYFIWQEYRIVKEKTPRQKKVVSTKQRLINGALGAFSSYITILFLEWHRGILPLTLGRVFLYAIAAATGSALVAFSFLLVKKRRKRT